MSRITGPAMQPKDANELGKNKMPGPIARIVLKLRNAAE